MTDIFSELGEKAISILKSQNLLDEPVRVKARTLSTKEAIGDPEGDDFPLQKGKERLMQAEFRGSLGQAFTDRFGDYEGSLKEIFSQTPSNNYRRAIFVSALNAVLRYLGHIENTVHCRDEGPTACAKELSGHIISRYGNPNIVQIGYQPKMVEILGSQFSIRVLDMDPDNIDTNKHGVLIESPAVTTEAVNWADIILVTGTTLVNDTLSRFLTSKPVIFYGTTIAGAAHLMGWKRFCACSS